MAAACAWSPEQTQRRGAELYLGSADAPGLSHRGITLHQWLQEAGTDVV